MKKFGFYDLDNTLEGTVTETPDGLVAENADDPNFKEFIDFLIESDGGQAKTVKELTRSGFSYTSIREIRDKPKGGATT
jgi:hypothetical protein